MESSPAGPKVDLDWPTSKVTPSMLESLKELKSCLLCPLCNGVLDRPATLNCAHTFCLRCINDWTCDSWTCPLAGCGMPVCIKRGGSYLKTNPQIDTVIVSLVTITDAINQSATEEWWKSPSSHLSQPPSSIHASTGTNDEDDTTEHKESDEVEDEEVVDLQADVESHSEMEKESDEDSSDIDEDEQRLAELQSRAEKYTFTTPSTKRTSSTKISTSLKSGGMDWPSDEKREKKSQTPCSFAVQQKVSICDDDENDKCKDLETISLHEQSQSAVTELNGTATGDGEELTQKYDTADESQENTEEMEESISMFQTAPSVADDNFQHAEHMKPTEIEPLSLTTPMVDNTSFARAECDARNMSCAIPQSQSPNFSPIATIRSPFATNCGIIDENNSSKVLMNDDDNDDTSKKSMTEIKLDSGDSSLPRVFLLLKSSQLSPGDTRTIRKCLNKGMFGMLQASQCDRFDNEDDERDWDLNFDFDDVLGSSAFQSILTSRVGGAETGSTGSASNCYAICTNSEFETFDGFLVPRSFPYLLALSCGMPIVDISYLREALSSTSLNRTTNYLYPPSIRERDQSTDRRSSNVKPKKAFEIIGDVESTNLMGPQRAVAASLSKRNSESIRTGAEHIIDETRIGSRLLSGYCFFLCGDFDVMGSRRRGADSRKRQRAGFPKEDPKDDSSSIYTKGRISILLKLCGAQVMDLSEFDSRLESTKTTTTATVMNDTSIDQMRAVLTDRLQRGKVIDSDGKVAILVRTGPNSRDFRLAKKFVDGSNCLTNLGATSLPVVSSNWLLDCIADFGVKPFDKYTGNGNKASDSKRSKIK